MSTPRGLARLDVTKGKKGRRSTWSLIWSTVYPTVCHKHHQVLALPHLRGNDWPSPNMQLSRTEHLSHSRTFDPSSRRHLSLEASAPTDMRLLRYLALTALSFTAAVSAKKAATTSKFDTYHGVSAPVELSEQDYLELTGTPRDYSVAVLLTARDAKYACGICREFDPEWSIVGRSWQKGDRTGAKRVVFGTLDFDQGRNVFMKVC